MDKNIIRLRHILDSMERIDSFLKDKTRDQFEDYRVHNVVVRELEIVGEASRHIDKDFQEKYSQVPWQKMGDLRNVLIHEYFGVNLDMVWKIATEEIVPVQKGIQSFFSEN